MELTFCSIGLEFTADVCYCKGRDGNYWNPPEPDELEMWGLRHTLTGTDVSFLLDSNVCDQLYEDAYDAFHDQVQSAKVEEAACAAEARWERQREEERMCRSC